VRDDERFVRGLVARLTRRHEAHEPRPWKMGDSEPAFIDALLRQVVGIEIAISSLQGKSKLSQNKSLRDRQGAAEQLAARGQHEMAQAMHPHTPD
jgi:transcriptional regulator